MEIRKYKNFRAFNVLGMQEFWLDILENGDDLSKNVVYRASQGYPEHFWAEIRFISVEYIACACFFLFAGLREALQQEKSAVIGKYPGRKIYCFEEIGQIPNRSPFRYYIVARDVEITAHYAGENIETVFGLSDRIEAGEEKDPPVISPSRQT